MHKREEGRGTVGSDVLSGKGECYGTI